MACSPELSLGVIPGIGGAFEMAQICTGYHPGKHPGINALDLPGLPLADVAYTLQEWGRAQERAVLTEVVGWQGRGRDFALLLLGLLLFAWGLRAVWAVTGS